MKASKCWSLNLAWRVSGTAHHNPPADFFQETAPSRVVKFVKRSIYANETCSAGALA
jgi:hypothetical protein